MAMAAHSMPRLANANSSSSQTARSRIERCRFLNSSNAMTATPRKNVPRKTSSTGGPKKAM